MRTKRDICRLSFALLLHSTVLKHNSLSKEILLMCYLTMENTQNT